jgi:hypothetical protein
VNNFTNASFFELRATVAATFDGITYKKGGVELVSAEEMNTIEAGQIDWSKRVDTFFAFKFLLGPLVDMFNVVTTDYTSAYGPSKIMYGIFPYYEWDDMPSDNCASV